jgi:type IV pilus assembly protein PilM
VFSTLIEVPVATESEIKKFIEFQGSQYIPLPLNEVAVDWMRVGERRAEDGVTKQQVLLVSIPNEQIERYKSICRAVGLRLVSIETEGVSIARALGARAKEPTIIIDIGGRSTNFTIAQNGFMKYGGHTDFSGGSITQAIANGLGINQRRAEDLKRQRGVISSGGNERELSTIILPILDVILYEAKRLITNYETNYHETVRSAVLTGGGANLVGIDAYFTEHFGFPTAKFDAFADIRAPQAISAISKNLSLSLGVAIGLGMKDFS